MEERFGEIGQGLTELTIREKRYDLDQLLRMMGMDHAIRYLDIEERCIVAYEFDCDFQYLGEQGAHIDEWMGDEYYKSPWAIFSPESA